MNLKQVYPLIFTLVFSSPDPVLPKYQPAGSRLAVPDVAMFIVTGRSVLAVSPFYIVYQ